MKKTLYKCGKLTKRIYTMGYIVVISGLSYHKLQFSFLYLSLFSKFFLVNLDYFYNLEENKCLIFKSKK